MKFALKQIAAAAVLAVAGVALAYGSWDSDQVRGTFKQTYNVSGPVDLEANNGSGDILVRQGSGSQVEISAKIYVNNRAWENSAVVARVREVEAHPPISQEGSTVRISKIDERDRRTDISINYEVTVPADTQLHSHTGSGDVTVDGIKGPVWAETGSGDLKMTGLRDNVSAHTGSGDTRLESIEAARVEIETGSGDVELHRVSCALEARTGSGDITAEGRPTGGWKLHSGSGNVTIKVPDDLGFDLDAQSGSGEVTTSTKSITVEGTLREGQLRGKVHGGGVAIGIETSSGDIRID